MPSHWPISSSRRVQKSRLFGAVVRASDSVSASPRRVHSKAILCCTQLMKVWVVWRCAARAELCSATYTGRKYSTLIDKLSFFLEKRRSHTGGKPAAVRFVCHPLELKSPPLVPVHQTLVTRRKVVSEQSHFTKKKRRKGETGENV